MFVTPPADRPTTADELLDARTLAALSRLDVRSTKLFPGKLQGERRSKSRGRSVEFDDHRLYAPGDDPRFIDWNAYARFGKLFVKLFLEDEDLLLTIAVDASASMSTGQPGKLVYAAKAAAALAAVGLSKNNRVQLTVFGAPGQRAPAISSECRGRRHVPSVLHFLLEHACQAPTAGEAHEGASFNNAISALAKQRSGTGVCVVLSDFLIPEGIEPALKALQATGGLDVSCIQTLSPQETEPTSQVTAGTLTGDLRLTDIEHGHGAEVSVSAELLKAYKARLDAHTSYVAEQCNKRGFAHALVTSDQQPQELLTKTLRAQGVIG